MIKTGAAQIIFANVRCMFASQGLTIHSSRRRFAARLNSGVRHCIQLSGGFVKKSIESIVPENHLSNDGQKEGFRTLHKTSDNTSSVDSEAIKQIGALTSEFIAASKESAASADTEDERTKRLNDAKEALREAREDIREVNMRSHQSQRGYATLAVKGMLVLAGAAVTGGLWLLSKK